MVLTERGKQALGGLALTIMVLRPIVFDHRCGHAWHHGPEVRMDHCRPPPLGRIGPGTGAGDLGQPRLTVPRLGGAIACAIERAPRGPMQAYPRFTPCAALALPQNAGAYRTH